MSWQPDLEFLEFLKSFKLPKGRPFVFKPHLLALYAYPLRQRKFVAIQKASQLGISTYAIARAIYECMHRKLDVMYVLSSWPVVKKFVLSKVDPILTAMGIQPRPDSIDTKGILNGIIHFTGGQKVTQAISITADFLILDEFSFLDPTTRDTFEDRLLASEEGMILQLSIPSGTESGIESVVAATKMFIWHVKCRSCGRTVPLDPREYERITTLDDTGKRWTFRCLVCSGPLDPNDPDAVAVRRSGFYVALNPSADRDGFIISTIYDSERSAEWFKQMEQKRDASRFYPGVIGIPYVVSIRIQFSDLVRMVLPENEWQEPKAVPVVAGVDYGKVFHIAYIALTDPPQVVRLSVQSDWQSALDELMIFKPKLTLIDELPPGDNYMLRDELVARGAEARLALARAPHNVTGDIQVDKRRVVYNNVQAFNQLFGAIQNNGIRFLRSRRLEELFGHILRARKAFASLRGRMYHTWVIGETAHFLDALKMAWLAKTIVDIHPSSYSGFAVDEKEGSRRSFETEEEFLDYIISRIAGMSWNSDI
jgi:hypothetical protein